MNPIMVSKYEGHLYIMSESFFVVPLDWSVKQFYATSIL